MIDRSGLGRRSIDQDDDRIDPEEELRRATQVAIRGVVGNTNIEEVLTTGRAQAQEQASQYIQALMDQDESGLLITEVKLQVVDPPDEVKDAFNEVVRAREDRERQQNEAQAYSEDIVPKARGEAAARIRADADRERTVILARAYEESQKLRGQGEAEATTIYAQAFGQDPEFYAFLRSLEAYETLLGSDSTMVLSTDSDLFR